MSESYIFTFNKSKLFTLYLLIIFFTVYTGQILSQGFLDPTFGNQGTVMYLVGAGTGQGDRIYSIKIQPDGKIVAAGNSVTSGRPYRFAVARFNPNGDPDSTFGDYGSLLETFPGSSGESGYSMVLQPDGKIVVAGMSSKLSGYFGFGLVRLNTNGTVDTSFNQNGFVRNYPGGENGAEDWCNSLLIQPDGKLVAVGQSNDGLMHFAFTAERVNSDGTIDSSFGKNGFVRIYINGSQNNGDYAYSSALQSDGKIILVGASWSASTLAGNAFGVARLNVDGSPDSSFGTNGSVSTFIYGSTANSFQPENSANSVGIQSDGKIVVGGYIKDSVSRYHFAIARYNTNGTLDNSFGSNGGTITTHIFGSDGSFDCANSLVIQPDGKILMAGTSSGSYAAARYNTNGSLDNSFGSNGTLQFQINGSAGGGDEVSSIALQQDGKIVLGGYSKDIYTSYEFSLARLYPNPTIGIKDQNVMVNSFNLFQNYPNPFNPSTLIKYQLPAAGIVSLKVYDILGKEVASLINGYKPAGYNQVSFNASALPSGVYIYQIRSGDYFLSRKMMLVK